MTVTYLLPLRREVPERPGSELVRYLRGLATDTDVLVVDGSAPDVLEAHRAAFGASVTVIAPAAEDRCANGKSWGVLTGLHQAGGDCVVIADDDVRWDRLTLAHAAELLQTCDLVLPQNFFTPMVWHAAWDSGRILVNRALGHDWPGTVVIRRPVPATGPLYDGNVLFENCELVRTVRAFGGRVFVAPSLFVARRPPSVRHFLGQRTRQAYDDLAQPLRLAVLLSVVPVTARGGWRAVAVIAAASVAAAEVGRRRGGGVSVFPWYTAWCAPLWLGERSVLAWWSVWRRVTGQGVNYSGQRLLLAATPERRLRRQRAGRVHQK